MDKILINSKELSEMLSVSEPQKQQFINYCNLF